jgi:anti-anti-sigma factor
MNVKVESSQDYTLVTVDGRIDTTNAKEFENAMMEVLGSGSKNIILDCSGLKYISSSGLRVFLIVLKKMKADKGQFFVCSLQPGIKEIFDISGFSTIFSLYPDKETSIIALKN